MGLVDAATGNIATNYTYDPLGSAAVTGTGYQTAYQFAGMENDAPFSFAERESVASRRSLRSLYSLFRAATVEMTEEAPRPLRRFRFGRDAQAAAREVDDP
jgi:hypothetical protein